MVLKEDEDKYPCKECLVFVICSKLCDKIEMNDYVILERIKKEKCCPDCGGNVFLENFCRGGMQEMTCTICKHKFHIVLLKALELHKEPSSSGQDMRFSIL